MAQLQEHNILVDYQHGFKQHRLCETLIMNTLEHPGRSLNYRTQTDLLISDFSKTFDSVAHKRLLLNLDCYGNSWSNFGLAAGVASK